MKSCHLCPINRAATPLSFHTNQYPHCLPPIQLERGGWGVFNSQNPLSFGHSPRVLTELDTVLPAATTHNQQRAKPHGQSPGKTRHKLPESSAGEVTQDALNSPGDEWCDNMHERLLPWKLIRASAHGLFTGAARPGPLCRHRSTPETPCRRVGPFVNSAGTESHSSLGEWCELFQDPRSQKSAKGQPCKQALLRRGARPTRGAPVCMRGRNESPIIKGEQIQLGRRDWPCANLSKHQRARLRLPTPTTNEGHPLKIQKSGLLRPREDTTGRN